MACTALGISKELALWSIQECGKRNGEFHCELDDLKREGGYSQLARVLYADRNDLDSTFSFLESETDLARLKEIIQGQIDDWFEDTELNPENPNTWVPSKSFRQFYNDAKKKAMQLSEEEIK